MFNKHSDMMRRHSMVSDLMDGRTPSNSKSAFEALADKVNAPKTAQPTQVGMFDQAIPETIGKLYPQTDLQLANMDRIGGLDKVRKANQSAKDTSKKYELESGLGFDMYDKIEDEGLAQQRAGQVSAFTNTPEYRTGLNNYMADMQDSTLSEDELKMYYANANGVTGKGSTLHYDKKKGDFSYTMPKFGLGDAIEIGTKGLLTFAVGGALTPMFAAAGLGTTAAASTGKAVASGLSSALQGGDIKSIATSAIFAGATEYASSISKVATNAMDSALAEGVNVTKETLASAASLADKAKIASNVSNALKVVKAVDNKDILSGLNAALALGGLDTPTEYARDVIEKTFGGSEWVSQNSDALAEASIKFVDKVTQGKSVEEALASSAVKYAKEGGGLSQLIPEGFDTGDFELDSEFIDTILEAGKNIDKEYIQPAKNTVVEIANQTGTFIKDNLPDVPDVDLKELKKTLSEINRKEIKPVVTDVKKFLSDVNKEEIKPVVTTVKESLSDFNEEEIKPVIADVKDFIKDIDLPDIDLPNIDFPSLNFPSLLSGGGTGISSPNKRADLVNIALTDPELVKGMEYDDLSNYLTKERTI
tara:strand:- start:2329 stop:4101 length:1773 start_codon:yes stop_codon:yes gene_type:complete